MSHHHALLSGWVAFALLQLGGCGQEASKACGEERFCPPKTTCDIDGCIVDSGHCDSFADGAPCQSAEGRGTCRAGSCEVRVEDAGSAGSSGSSSVDSGTGGAAGAGTGGAAGVGGGAAGGGAGEIIVSDSCPAFSGCGGDLVGAWDIERVCVSARELFARTVSNCPMVTFEDTTGTFTGDVTFTATTVTLRSGSMVETTATFPAACIPTTCAAAEALLEAVVDSATCTDVPLGGCRCTILRSGTADITEPYTANGSTFTLGGGRSFEYCVRGGELEYIETTPLELAPGLFTLRPD